MAKVFRSLSVMLMAFGLAAVFAGTANAFTWGDLEIKPFGSASEQYNDNITATKSDKISDSITSLTAGAVVTMEGKDQKLDLTGSVTQELFAQENNFDNTSERLALDYTRDLSQLSRFGVNESFTHAETPTTFADQFGVAAGRYSYYLNRFGADYSHDINSQLSMAVGYQNEIYNTARAGESDSDLNGITTSLNYAISSATILTGRYGLSRRSYNPGGDVTANTLDVGGRQYLTKQFYVDAFVGVSFLDPSDGKRTTDPRYSLAVTDEFSQKTKLTAAFRQQHDTNYSNQDIFDSWQANLDLTHSLFERLGLTMSLFYGDGKYVNSGVDQKFMGASARLDYELTRKAVIFISQNYSSTNSTLDSEDYTRNISEAGVSIKF